MPADFIFLFMIRVDPSPILFFYFLFFFDPSWIESIRVDPDWRPWVDRVWLLYLPDSEAYMLLVDSKNVTDISFIDINTKTDKEEES